MLRECYADSVPKMFKLLQCEVGATWVILARKKTLGLTPIIPKDMALDASGRGILYQVVERCFDTRRQPTESWK